MNTLNDFGIEEETGVAGMLCPWQGSGQDLMRVFYRGNTQSC